MLCRINTQILALNQVHAPIFALDLHIFLHGSIYRPYALERKYPNADREWFWQYIFPADHRTGPCRRHHLYDSSIQKVLKPTDRIIPDRTLLAMSRHILYCLAPG